MCWSGGKDSAYALWEILRAGEFEVCGLLTTVSMPYDRISMHGVRRELLEKQAAATGLPLYVAEVSEKTNEAYENVMLAWFEKFRSEGITHVIFGDIFLEDLKKYRDELLQRVSLTGVYPLWERDTKTLAKNFIDNGFRTITCCVSDAILNEDWCGKEFDAEFLRLLPASVDPCGENGEFHTFCFDGPVFKTPVAFEKGERVYRPLEMKTADLQMKTKGFWYCDLL
jgi:uncharacterized protein (TIGR00290 family)